MANIAKIEELRIQHGMTQEQIAIKLGYGSKSTYNCKIKGIRQFTIDDIIAICKIFNVTPNDLIDIQ